MLVWPQGAHSMQFGMDTPELSIIIPTYNEALLLPRLFASLKEQTGVVCEIIVADAHSTDATRDLAIAAGAHVVDGGMPGVGRNAGAAIARAPYLLFVDADILLPSPHTLTQTMQLLREGASLVSARVNADTTGTWADRVVFGLYNLTSQWKKGSVHPVTHGFFIAIEKLLHEKIGGFDPTILLAEDLDYGHRACATGARYQQASFFILQSPRRLHRDGHLRILITNMLVGLHMLFRGPVRTNLFRYTFGHTKK